MKATPHHHRTCLAAPTAAALITLLISSAAVAQNYTGVSVLEPFGTLRTKPGDILNSGLPVVLAQDGTVIGRAMTGTQRSFNVLTLSFNLRYTLQTVRWASSATTGSVKPTKVSSTVWPVTGNAQGNWAGYALSSTQIWHGTGLPRLGLDMPAVSINGKITKINGATGMLFEPVDMNKQNWVLGKALGDANGWGSQIRAVVWKNGVATELDKGSSIKAFPTKMNDQGDVVGTVRDEVFNSAGGLESYTERAALWVNGKLAWVGPDRSDAFSINNMGQFLVRTPDQPSGIEIRTTSGGVTPVVFPDYVAAFDMRLNNKGEIGGIYSRYDPVTFSMSTQRPFIMKNGVLQDVYTLLEARGIRLTPGQRDNVQHMDAFTDLGGMVINHDNPFNSWMRINVAP
jgi:hypothetical protein